MCLQQDRFEDDKRLYNMGKVSFHEKESTKYFCKFYKYTWSYQIMVEQFSGANKGLCG